MRKSPRLVTVDEGLDPLLTFSDYAARKHFTGVFVYLPEDTRSDPHHQKQCFKHLCLPAEFVEKYSDWLAYQFKSKKNLFKWYKPRRDWLTEAGACIGYHHGTLILFEGREV